MVFRLFGTLLINREEFQLELTTEKFQPSTQIEELLDWGDFLKKCSKDPWFFAVNCVFTTDEVDQTNPTKRFPKQFKYLEYFFKIWTQERMIAVPKSRRMFMSWATLTLHVWDAMF